MKSTAKYWIEVFQGRESDSPFFFRIKARNGAIVMHSASRNKIVDRLSLVHGFEVRKGLP